MKTTLKKDELQRSESPKKKHCFQKDSTLQSYEIMRIPYSPEISRKKHEQVFKKPVHALKVNTTLQKARICFYSAFASSAGASVAATSSAVSTASSAAGAASTAAEDFLLRRVRVDFFLVFAMFSS